MAEEQLDEQLTASAPGRGGLELQRSEREVEERLFGTRRPPLTLSRYILLRELAKGGAGIVYSAFDPELDRKVAIKLIRSGSRAAEGRIRLLREAQAMARLDHPNVIPVHDVGTYGPRDLDLGDRKPDIPARGVFVVMELADGVELRKWLRQRQRPWREVVSVFRDAAAGLGAAHRAGLVHRDFKPSNVIVGDDGRVRVLDFGLARAVSVTGESPAFEQSPQGSPPVVVDSLTAPLTSHGVVMGTPAYMSPEQHRGEAVDERSDQYSFCAALYEAAHGRLPFPQRKMAQLRQAKEDADFAQRTAARIPRWLDRLIAKGLAPDPAARHTSMEVIHDALGRDRRRAILWGAVAMGGVSTVLGVAYSQREVTACADQVRELDGIWDAATRARIEAAFLASGVSYAEQTAETVAGDLDRYTAQWLEHRTRVCEAGLVDGAVPMAETSRAILCLDRKLTRVGGLTQLFASADAKLVERARLAVADLPSLQTCSTTAAGHHGPPTVESREETLAIEAEIARSAALTHATRLDEAVSLARAAVEHAEHAGAPATLGRALEQLARVHTRRAEHADAELAARRALREAERALDPELAIACLIRVAYIVGASRARTEEALHMLDVAQAKAEGISAGNTLRRRLLVTRGQVLEKGGRFREALADLTDALALEQSSPVERPSVVGHILNTLGVAHDRLGDYPKALSYYERALEIRRVLGDSHPDVGNGLGNVGITLSRVGRYEEAVAALEEAHSIDVAALGPEHPSTAWVGSNLGAVFHMLGRYKEAEVQIQDAFAARERVLGPEHPVTALALRGLAWLYADMGRPEALELATRGLRIAELRPDNHSALAGALLDYGAALASVGKHDEAIAAFTRSEALITEATGPEHPRVAEVLGLRGRSEVALGRGDAAIALMERSLAMATRARLPDLELVRTRFALARALGSKDAPRAVALAEQVLATLEADAPDRLERGRVLLWLETHRRDR